MKPSPTMFCRMQETCGTWSSRKRLSVWSPGAGYCHILQAPLDAYTPSARSRGSAVRAAVVGEVDTAGVALSSQQETMHNCISHFDGLASHVPADPCSNLCL